jgi:peptidase YpeB-like protein
MSGRKTSVWIVGGALAVALIGGGAAIAVAGGGDDDRPLTGSNLEKATAAALAHTGGGTVIETEVGDDGAAYGVEIRRDDGSVVEVSLDTNFSVIGDEADDDGPNEEDGRGED